MTIRIGRPPKSAKQHTIYALYTEQTPGVMFIWYVGSVHTDQLNSHVQEYKLADKGSVFRGAKRWQIRRRDLEIMILDTWWSGGTNPEGEWIRRCHKWNMVPWNFPYAMTSKDTSKGRETQRKNGTNVWDPEFGRAGGLIGAPKSHEAQRKNKTGFWDPKVLQKGQRQSGHVRWHVHRGRTSSKCEFCFPTLYVGGLP